MTFRQLRFSKFQIAVHLAALTPLALLIWDLSQQNLTANPIQEITQRTGKTAFILLVLTLAVTPANTLTGFRQAIKVRRALGLYAFLYAAIHFLIFIVVDYGLDLELIWLETLEKRYVLVGFAALMILLPLAITSTRGWQRRLGKAWKRLHKFVYAVGILVAIHYIWVVKSLTFEPIFYSTIIVLLLVARIPYVRKAMVRFRTRATHSLRRIRTRNHSESAKTLS